MFLLEVLLRSLTELRCTTLRKKRTHTERQSLEVCNELRAYIDYVLGVLLDNDATLHTRAMLHLSAMLTCMVCMHACMHAQITQHLHQWPDLYLLCLACASAVPAATMEGGKMDYGRGYAWHAVFRCPCMWYQHSYASVAKQHRII